MTASVLLTARVIGSNGVDEVVLPPEPLLPEGMLP